LTRIPVPVDTDGIDVDRLESLAVQAVFVTPAHQFPTGVVLGKERRRKLVAWLRQRPTRYAIEDDYDAEFRYDQAPLGALQGLVRDKVIYAGTVSKTLAPGLRLGWLVVPRDLLDCVQSEQRRWSEGCPRIEQNALANFIESGRYDQHLRRMRRIYRRRRSVLIESLARHLPQAEVSGIAAGLHAAVRLPTGINEDRICAAVAKRGVAADVMHKYRVASKGPPTLLLGFGRASESALRAGVRILAQAITDGGS
jgi:GntR family transcriptional regulator / MocR family aminotransferase